MKLKAAPPRLHVLLSRDGRTGVIIRRGPSKVCCTIGWDRVKDEFTIGQWLRGRIFERRCDLSPDGRHLIYFTYKGAPNSTTGGSYTGISLAPWLNAIGLWGNGSAWNGGGLFVSDTEYWLNRFYCAHKELRIPPGLSSVERPFEVGYGGECPGVYYPRLMRDGWHLTGEEERDGWNITLFDKPLNFGWVLRKEAHEGSSIGQVGKGCYWDCHRLMHDRKESILCPDWEWADDDHGRRVVWTSNGSLYAARITRSGLDEPLVLQDFTPMTYRPLRAPYEVPPLPKE